VVDLDAAGAERELAAAVAAAADEEAATDTCSTAAQLA
jgi:hypothetical protein